MDGEANLSTVIEAPLWRPPSGIRFWDGFEDNEICDHDCDDQKFDRGICRHGLPVAVTYSGDLQMGPQQSWSMQASCSTLGGATPCTQYICKIL